MWSLVFSKTIKVYIWRLIDRKTREIIGSFRQRISRLVRESLSFSKKMENHVGEPFGILSMTTMHSTAKQSKGLSRHHYYRITTLNFLVVVGHGWF